MTEHKSFLEFDDDNEDDDIVPDWKLSLEDFITETDGGEGYDGDGGDGS